MKTGNSKQTEQKGRLFRRVGQQLSIDRALGHFQGVLLCVDQFGFCAGLTTSFLTLISFLLHAAHTGAEKGVI